MLTLSENNAISIFILLVEPNVIFRFNITTIHVDITNLEKNNFFNCAHNYKLITYLIILFMLYVIYLLIINK